MSHTLAIELTDAERQRLSEMADRLGIAMEALAHAVVVDMIERPDEQFEQAVRYVLEKNDELYERLA